MSEETAIIPSDLPTNQQQALELVVAGQTDQKVADQVGVARETVCRWRQQPEFRAALNKYQTLMQQAAADRLRALVNEALEGLADALADENPRVKIQAAVHILKAAGLYSKHLPAVGPTTAEAVIARERQEEYFANL